MFSFLKKRDSRLIEEIRRLVLNQEKYLNKKNPPFYGYSTEVENLFYLRFNRQVKTTLKLDNVYRYEIFMDIINNVYSGVIIKHNVTCKEEFTEQTLICMLQDATHNVIVSFDVDYAIPGYYDGLTGNLTSEELQACDENPNYGRVKAVNANCLVVKNVSIVAACYLNDLKKDIHDLYTLPYLIPKTDYLQSM